MYLLLARFVSVSRIFQFYRRSCHDIYVNFSIKLYLHLGYRVPDIVLMYNHTATLSAHQMNTRSASGTWKPISKSKTHPGTTTESFLFRWTILCQLYPWTGCKNLCVSLEAAPESAHGVDVRLYITDITEVCLF